MWQAKITKVFLMEHDLMRTIYSLDATYYRIDGSTFSTSLDTFFSTYEEALKHWRNLQIKLEQPKKNIDPQ